MKEFILVAELKMVKKTYLSFYFKGGYSGINIKEVRVRYAGINRYPLIVGRGYILHLRHESSESRILCCQLLKIRAL